MITRIICLTIALLSQLSVASAAPVIVYNSDNLPTMVSNLVVPGHGVYSFTVTYDSFDNVYGTGTPPANAGIPFGDQSLAIAMGSELVAAMNLDATPDPTPVNSFVAFPVSATPTSASGWGARFWSAPDTEWTNIGINLSRSDASWGWATVSVPEPSAFVLLALVATSCVPFALRQSRNRAE